MESPPPTHTITITFIKKGSLKFKIVPSPWPLRVTVRIFRIELESYFSYHHQYYSYQLASVPISHISAS